MKKSAKLPSGKKSAKQGRLTSSHRGIEFFSVWPHKLRFLAKLLQSPKRAKNMIFPQLLFVFYDILLLEDGEDGADDGPLPSPLHLPDRLDGHIRILSQTGRGSVDKVSFFRPFSESLFMSHFMSHFQLIFISLLSR